MPRVGVDAREGPPATLGLDTLRIPFLQLLGAHTCEKRHSFLRVFPMFVPSLSW
jgi:hypothetical protein